MRLAPPQELVRQLEVEVVADTLGQKNCRAARPIPVARAPFIPRQPRTLAIKLSSESLHIVAIQRISLFAENFTDF